MSLLLKSEQNLEAAEILLASKLFAPVIHSAYYSSLQYIMYLVNEYVEISDDDYKAAINDKGSHNFYINAFSGELMKINKFNASKFANFVKKFKRKRREADYGLDEISIEDSRVAQEQALRIKKFLNIFESEGECKNIYLL